MSVSVQLLVDTISFVGLDSRLTLIGYFRILLDINRCSVICGEVSLVMISVSLQHSCINMFSVSKQLLKSMFGFLGKVHVRFRHEFCWLPESVDELSYT